MEDSERQRSVASPLLTTIDQHPGHADHTTSTLRGVELELAVLIGSDCSSSPSTFLTFFFVAALTHTPHIPRKDYHPGTRTRPASVYSRSPARRLRHGVHVSRSTLHRCCRARRGSCRSVQDCRPSTRCMRYGRYSTAMATEAITTREGGEDYE